MYSTAGGTPKTGWPGTWEEQFKAYCKLLGRTEYTVAVLYLLPPELIVGTFRWSQQEIDDNWTYVKGRAAIFLAHTEKKLAPAPFTYNREWECKNCRYLLRCQTQKDGKE